jgi:hypothetical protein
MKLKKNSIKKMIKTKQISIKITRTEFNTKIKWQDTLLFREEIQLSFTCMKTDEKREKGYIKRKRKRNSMLLQLVHMPLHQ